MKYKVEVPDRTLPHTVEADFVSFEDGVAAFYNQDEQISRNKKGVLVTAFRSWDEVKGPGY